MSRKLLLIFVWCMAFSIQADYRIHFENLMNIAPFTWSKSLALTIFDQFKRDKNSLDTKSSELKQTLDMKSSELKQTAVCLQKLAPDQSNNDNQQRIVIVTPSYNNIAWCQRNLESVFGQCYNNWILIYIDDCSCDGTYEAVCSYIKERQQEHRVRIIHNEEHTGKAIGNIYKAVWLCQPQDIVVCLDGDDWLASEDVFAYLNEVYRDPNIWLTYGQFREWTSGNKGFCAPYPKEVIKDGLFRKCQMGPSHLRTFRAALFQKIDIEDLKIDGEFLAMSWDLAMMIPMVEMARDNHFMFIDKILLTYNDVNSISDHRISRELQRSLDLMVRAKKPYEALGSLYDQTI